MVSPILYELGLEAALKRLAKQTQEKYELQIELKDDGKSKSLDNDCRVIAFQAARELLFNIVKHAQAKKRIISTTRDDDAVASTFKTTASVSTFLCLTPTISVPAASVFSAFGNDYGPEEATWSFIPNPAVVPGPVLFCHWSAIPISQETNRT